MPETTCAQCAGPARKKYCSRECYYRASKGTKRVEHVQAICACGKTFETRAARVTSGRGKFCSKACQYANATRPSGLTYEIKVENPTSFRPGHQTWNKGTTGVMPEPWNKGLAGIHLSPDTEFKPGHAPTNWKGDEVGYFALHAWLRRAYGVPASCEDCGSDSSIQWANRTGQYLRDRDDWLHLCQRCHRRYDLKHGLIGIVAKRFP